MGLLSLAHRMSHTQGQRRKWDAASSHSEACPELPARLGHRPHARVTRSPLLASHAGFCRLSRVSLPRPHTGSPASLGLSTLTQGSRVVCRLVLASSTASGEGTPLRLSSMEPSSPGLHSPPKEAGGFGPCDLVSRTPAGDPTPTPNDSHSCPLVLPGGDSHPTPLPPPSRLTIPKSPLSQRHRS